MAKRRLPTLKIASLSLVSRQYQLFALLFVTGLTLTFVPAATAQTRPSDVEMKEVMRLLLEREVPRSADGTTVTVLLDPNVRSGWVPEAPGFAIRQLSYDEQKRVPEYYEFTWRSIKRDVLEVSLTKGNYCVKAGRRYEFRRKAGAWQAKVVGDVEFNTGSGSRCYGCAVGSGATYSVRPQITNRPAALAPPAGNLRLTGSVGKVDCSKDDKYVRCNAELNLKFTNIASTPVIILQPSGEYKFWHGGTSLALSEEESRANSLVYIASAWPSVYKFPMYQTLANLLDQSDPPPGVTRVLLPNASWNWDTSIMLKLAEGNSCDQQVGVEIGWEEVKQRNTPLWLRVSYEMWPFNVENFKPNLGSILQKRWQRHGSLYLDEKSGKYLMAILTSEPIEFPLNQIDLPPIIR